MAGVEAIRVMTVLDDAVLGLRCPLQCTAICLKMHLHALITCPVGLEPGQPARKVFQIFASQCEVVSSFSDVEAVAMVHTSCTHAAYM